MLRARETSKHLEKVFQDTSGVNAKISLHIPALSRFHHPLHMEVRRFFDTQAGDIFAAQFGNATLTTGNRVVLNEDQTTRIEQVTVVSAYFRLEDTEDIAQRLETVKTLADILKKVLYQDSVLLSVEPVTLALYI